MPLSVIMIPGTFMAYCYRFDVNQNSHAFTFYSFLGLFVGNLKLYKNSCEFYNFKYYSNSLLGYDHSS